MRRRNLTSLILETPLGIHGAGMTEKELVTRLGYGGIEIEKSGPITDDEAERIAKKIADELPERIYAYSRGAAALNKAMLDDDMPADLPPVTYVAPAAMRGWTDAPVPKLPAGSVTIIGDQDEAVPVKQACRIAQQAGTPLYVHPDKNHISVLYTQGDTSGAEELDVDRCLADNEMPDWGDGNPSKKDIQKQQDRSRALTGESLLRAVIREIFLK